MISAEPCADFFNYQDQSIKAMSHLSNAGLRRSDGGLANALGNLSVGHQGHESEYLVNNSHM